MDKLIQFERPDPSLGQTEWGSAAPLVLMDDALLDQDIRAEPRTLPTAGGESSQYFKGSRESSCVVRCALELEAPKRL